MKYRIMIIVWFDKFKTHKLNLILNNYVNIKFILFIKIRHS